MCEQELGLVHLYCGDGKGKTTAAAGLAVRAAGAGKRVVFAQFMKGNESSELCALRRIPGITIRRAEKCFGFFKNMTEEEKKELRRMQDAILFWCIKQVEQEACDLLVLDEVTHAWQRKMADIPALEQLILSHGKTELVLTGRNPADFLMEHADYVTEMKKIRHPFDRGIAARKGIEL